MIAKLASQKRDMEVVGHGALRNAGRASKADVVLSTSGLKGVTLYEPTEIVMSARAGTRGLRDRGHTRGAWTDARLRAGRSRTGDRCSGWRVVDRRRLCDEFFGLQTHRGGKRAG